VADGLRALRGEEDKEKSKEKKEVSFKRQMQFSAKLHLPSYF